MAGTGGARLQTPTVAASLTESVAGYGLAGWLVPGPAPEFAMPSLDQLAFEAEQEIGRIKNFFPILPALGNRWAATRPWAGRTFGLNLHVTTVTAAFVQELSLGGADCIVSAAEPGTTDPGSVQLLRNSGVEVYTGGDMEDRHLQVLDHNPDVLVDIGFDLVATCLDKRSEQASQVMGAAELSTSGLARLRRRRLLPFPVLNVRDGHLPRAVESRHGIGEAVWQAVTELTGMHLAGRQVAVLGYGPVGRGIASWARNAGMAVEVVETDPIRRLFAHYDGFHIPELADALRRVQLVVTATGATGALTARDLDGGRDGLVLLNAGRGHDEIDVDGIRSVAERVDNITDHVVCYRLENGTSVTVLGDGRPLNIKLNAGSPEPVLLHFTVLGLALEWMMGQALGAGEVQLPRDVEDAAARMALTALAVPGHG